jgi:hypothetical protein
MKMSNKTSLYAFPRPKGQGIWHRIRNIDKELYAWALIRVQMTGR